MSAAFSRVRRAARRSQKQVFRLQPVARSFGFVIAAWCAVFWLAGTAQAKVRYWVGEVSDQWADASNWDEDPPFDSLGPQDGDDLVFDPGRAANTDPMFNHLQDLNVRSLTFHGSGDTWELNGNTLVVTHDISTATLGEDLVINLNCGIRLGADAEINANTKWRTTGNEHSFQYNLPNVINLNGHTLTLTAGLASLINVSGVISGTGNVVVKGTGFPGTPGIVEFSGPSPNTFSGTMTLTTSGAPDGDYLEVDARFNKSTGPVVKDRLVIQNRALLGLEQPEQIGDTADVEILGGDGPTVRYPGDDSNVTVGGTPQVSSGLFLNGHDETIRSLILQNFAGDSNPCFLAGQGGTLTVSGNIESVAGSDVTVPYIAGKLNLADGSHGIQVDSEAGPGRDGLYILAGISGNATNAFISVLGGGNLVPSGANSFAGEWAVSDHATLEIIDSRSLNNNSVILVGSASLILQNVTVNGCSLGCNGTGPITPDTPFGVFVRAIGNCTWNGPVDFNTGLAVYADQMTFNGPMTGNGTLELLNDVVTLGGQANNTYTGATFVHCGFLRLIKPPGIKPYSGPLIVGGGAGAPYEVRWLDSGQNPSGDLTLFSNGLVNLNDRNVGFGTITFNGGHIKSGVGELSFKSPLVVNPSSSTALIEGVLGLQGPGDAVFQISLGTADPSLQISGAIIGAGVPLVKVGPGTLKLSGQSQYTGPTEVNEGVLQVDSSGALGVANDTTVTTNATLRVSGLATVPETLVLSGAGAIGSDGTAQGALQVVNGATVTWTGSMQLQGATTINVGTGGSLSINAPISGVGPMLKVGNGTLNLGGNSPNSYADDTVVRRGTLALSKPDNILAVPGNLVVGGGIATVKYAGSFQLGGPITVDRFGILDLNGHKQDVGHPPLNLLNGGRVQTGTGILLLPEGADILVSPGIIGASFISGNLGLDVGPHHVTVGSREFGASGPECTIDAVVSQTSPDGGLVKDGSGRLVLSAVNTYRGNTVVAGGTLEVDGTIEQSQVEVTSGLLQGEGTAGPILLNGSNAVVAPHFPSGSLACDGLAADPVGGGIVRIEIDGTKAGTDYDQLLVRGPCNLSNITLNASLNFSSDPGDVFNIIPATPDNPPQGTINGLPPDTVFTISDEPFTVDYAGAGGFAVVLTHASSLTVASSVWTNSFGGDWSNPLNWDSHTVPAFSSATVTNNGGYTITNGANVTITKFTYANPQATLANNGSLTMSGLFDWQAGTLTGPGVVSANGGMHISDPPPSSAKGFSSGTILNSGVALWTGNGAITFGGGAVFSNGPAATFDCSGNGSMENAGSSNLVVNAGLFRKTGGAGTTRINVPFNNTGTVEVNSGTLSLNSGGTNTSIFKVAAGSTFVLGSGTHIFTSGSTVTGQGNLSVNGANVTLGGQVNITGDHLFTAGTINFAGDYSYQGNALSISGSTVNYNGTGTIAPASLSIGEFGNLGGTNPITVSGPMTLSSSSQISGNNAITANGELTISGSVTISGRTLINTTSALWTNSTTGSIELADGAVITNAPTAVFECVGNGFVLNSTGANLFANAGLFRLDDSSTITIQAPFNNDNTVEVPSGHLILQGGGTSTGSIQVSSGGALTLGGGTHFFAPASSITGDGDFEVGAGVANLAGLVNVSGTHTFSFGTAEITGDYSCVNNTLNITGGTVNFNGTGAIAPAFLNLSGFGVLGGSSLVTVSGPINWGGAATIGGSGTVIANGGVIISGGAQLSGRTLVNLGVTTWSNNVISALTLDSGAVWSNAPGAVFDCAFDGILQNSVGTNVFVNAGTFRKVGGTNTTEINIPFINSGIVEADSGTLSFDAAFSAENGGLLRMRGGNIITKLPLQLLHGALKGNGVVSGAVMNHGTVSPGASPGQITIAGDYTQAADGELDIEIAGTNPGTDFDRLIVGNTANLDGTLNVTFLNGFSPAPNSSFVFLVSSNSTGTFANFNYPFRDVGLALRTSPSNVTLQVVNTRPSIDPIAAQTASRLLPFSLAIHATDADIPAQTLSYRLLNPPAGATIDTNGVMNWTPGADQPVTNQLQVVVTDNGTPRLATTNSFEVVLAEPPGASSVTSLVPGNPDSHSFTLTFSGTTNAPYVTEFTTNILGPWLSLATNVAGPDGVWSVTDITATNAARFYRSRWLADP